MKVKLSEIFDLQMGKTPSRNNSEYWNGDNKWVSISDLGNCNKFISETKECISDKGIMESKIKIVPKDTVIMSFKLSIGKTAITAEDMYTNEAIMAFINKKKYDIDINYLYHLLSGYNWSEGTNKAVLGLTLNKATLSQKKIPLPILKEQQKIAAVLDKVSELIALRKKQLEKLDELVKSRFIEMFGDPIYEKKYQGIPLRKLCKTISGGTPSTKIPEYYNGNIPWISTVSLGNNHIDGSNAKGYITKNAIEHSATHLIPAGNILFGIRVGVGKSSLNDVDICTNQDVVAIIGIDETKYSKLFIKHVLDAYQPHFCNIKKGATILGITTDDLKNSLIPQVPIKLQKNYEKFVYQVDKQKLTIQQGLDKLEVLKKALMQQYFG